MVFAQPYGRFYVCSSFPDHDITLSLPRIPDGSASTPCILSHARPLAKGVRALGRARV